MSVLNGALVAAAQAAVSLSLARDEDEPSHLSAQRRFDEDGAEIWEVEINDHFAPDMTHITDRLTSDFPWIDGDVVADIIARCWEPDWDIVPDGRGGYVPRSVAEAEDEAA